MLYLPTFFFYLAGEPYRGEMTALHRDHQAALTQRESEWQRRISEEQERSGALELRCARADALNENGKREMERSLELLDENKRLRETSLQMTATKARCELAQEAMTERVARCDRDIGDLRRQLQQERDRNIDLQCRLSVEHSKNEISQVGGGGGRAK